MTEKEFLKQLQHFYRLLQKENQALIKDEGERLLSIVGEKETMVSVFETYDGPVQGKLRDFLVDIKALQEENLLLTNQALSYQQMFMETIQQQLKKQTPVYTDKNHPYQSASATIINQDM